MMTELQIKNNWIPIEFSELPDEVEVHWWDDDDTITVEVNGEVKAVILWTSGMELLLFAREKRG